MANIAATDIGTSDPVDLCKGFALFPGLGTARAGISANNETKQLFRLAPTILAWKLNANASYSFFFGICGPSYGFKMTAQGQTSGDSITLNLSDDVVEGGFFVGMQVNLNINITVQQWTPKWVWDGWHSHIRTTWEQVGNFTVNPQFDIIGLIIAVLLYINDKSDDKNVALSKVTTALPGITQSWGFYDLESNEIASQGNLSVEPVLSVPINVAQFIPELEAVNKALALLWGGIAFGPQVGISIPTDIEITQISVDGQNYTNLQFNNGTVTGTGGTATDNPQNLTFTMQHTPHFDFQVGVFASFYILKLINIGFQYAHDVLGLLGITVSLGSHTNTVTNTIGSDSISGAARGAHRIQEADLFEVILAPPSMVPV